MFKPQTDFKGQYGTFSIDANGNWTFKLDNDAKAIQQLGAKDSLTEKFTVTTADGTTGQVVITINGTNDNPTITGLATGDVKEDGTLTTTGQLTQHDIDATDKHTWSVNNDGKGQYGTFTVDATGKWTYVLDNKSAQVQAPGRRPEGHRHHHRHRRRRQRRHRHPGHHRHHHRHQ